MTQPTTDETVRAWLESAATGPIESALRDRVLEGVARHRPLPALVAAVGSHWPPRPWGASTIEAGFPVQRRSTFALAFLAIVVATAIVGGAMVIRLSVPGPAAPASPSRSAGAARPLLYEQDGDVFLADITGAAPTFVADGVPSTDRLGTWFAVGVEAWAPDGEHFIYNEFRPTDGQRVITHIADPAGRSVATFEILPVPPIATIPPLPDPAVRWERGAKRSIWATRWSPDSTLIATMPWGADAITIWGLDGTVRMTLPVPAGYSDWRELGMRWAPDGRAVLAALTKGSGAVSAREVWRLPVDRSTPDRLPDDHPYARWDPAVSPEGNRIAYSGLNDPDVRRSIYVANVDGSEPRAVPATAQTNGDPGFPRWSPDGTRLEYAVGLSQGGLRYALHVVEIASGVDTIVLEGLDDGWGNIEWSPDGEWLLVRALDVGPTVHGIVPGGPVKTNLWRVHPDGSGLLRLVDDIEAFDVVR